MLDMVASARFAEPLCIWLFRVDALCEVDLFGLLPVLSPQERSRLGRFHRDRNRIEYAAAHVLTRFALADALGLDPSHLEFAEAPGGKPVARLRGRELPVSFNLSHTAGMVGVAVLPRGDVQVGFDLERLDRAVDFSVADQFFRPEEVQLLQCVGGAERRRTFYRLWTLKEAMIKATGEGLSRKLDTFWFDLFPPRVHLAPSDETEAWWHFEQRLIGRAFVAAAAVQCADGVERRTRWKLLALRELGQMTRTGVS